MPSTHPSENRDECLGEFESRSVSENPIETQSKVLTAREFLQTLPRFFFLFYKVLFSTLTKKKTIHEAHTVYETVNSHNLKIFNHIVQMIFVLHSATKTHF